MTAVLAIVLVVLVAVLFALALAEASLMRVRASAVTVAAEQGDRRAATLLGLIDDLPRVMNAILFAVLLAQVTAASTAGFLARSWFGGAGVTAATVIVSLVLFVYGEAIPKTIAVRHPLAVGRTLAGPVRWLSIAARPVVGLLVRFADVQTPGSGISMVSAVSEEELLHLADEAATAGQIDEADAELIERSFTFGDLRVGQILVPLADVVAVPLDLSDEEALQIAIAAGHRRLVVFDGQIDRIVGFVRLRDLAGGATDTRPETVAAHVRDVLRVRDSDPLVAVLRRMQDTGRHLAVVVDARSTTLGIVTVEDVVEELVGTIEDR